MNIRRGENSHEAFAKIQDEKWKAEKRKTKTTVEKDEDEEAEAEKESQITEISMKHYRSYYDDELENNKDLFPRMPFYSFDIWRGQSRGAKKSSWFGGGDVDESG